MAEGKRRFVVEILGDAKGLAKANKDAEGSTLSLQERTQKLGEAIAGAYVVTAVVNFGKAAVSAAMDDARAQQQLAVTLRNTTGARDADIESVEKFIATTQNATGVLDDQLRPAFGNLVRATRDAAKAQDLLTLAVDVSAATGRDLEAVSLALARAAQGNVGALGRMGVATKDAKGEALSFDEVLGNLSTTFGGAAAANAETAAGKMQILQARFADVQETVGTALLPAVEQAAEVLQALTGWFAELDPEVQQAIVQIALFGGGVLALVKTVSSATAAISGFAKATALSNPVLLGVAGVAAAASLIYVNYARKKADARERTEELTEALKEEAAGNKDAVAQALAKQLADQKLIERSEKLGVTAADLAKVLRGEQVPAYERVLELQEELRRFGGSTGDSQMDRTRVQANLLAQEVEKMADAYRDAQKAVKAEADQKVLAESIAQDLGTTLEDTTDAVDEETEATEESTKAKERQRKAVDNVTEALRSKLEATLASFSSELGLRDAARGTADAMNELAEMTKKGKASADEISEAQDAAAGAALRQAAAATQLAEEQAKARGQTLSARDAAKVQREELEKIAATLAPDSPLRAQLQAYIRELQTIPTDVQTSITATARNADGSVARRTMGVRAAGGPVLAGNTYLVGEDGPELVTPDANANVVPMSAAPMVAGATTNVVINAPAGMTPDQIVAAIVAYERRNGASWRRN